MALICFEMRRNRCSIGAIFGRNEGDFSQHRIYHDLFRASCSIIAPLSAQLWLYISMFELNPVFKMIDDMLERTATLRGYL